MADDRPTIEDLTRRSRTLNGLYAGTFWQHTKSGGVYQINSIAIREADYEPWMQYSPVGNPDLKFDRALAELREIVGTDDMPYPRFFPVRPKTEYVRAYTDA